MIGGEILFEVSKQGDGHFVVTGEAASIEARASSGSHSND